MLSKNIINNIFFKIIFLIVLNTGISFSVSAQQENKVLVTDSNSFNKTYDTLIRSSDTLLHKTIAKDSTKSKKSNPIKDKIIYKSTDSLRFNVKEKKVYLFNTSDISYQKINLKAYNIEMDFKKNEVFAKGVEDSTGEITGSPVFKESDKNFNTKELLYNFNTKKGLIKEVITKENDNEYIHGELVKKMSDDVTYIKNGKFTTCDLEHPHFDIRFGRAKAIPDKKIVTGPAFLYIEDIPTPLFIPVGYFPNSRKQTSGILIPAYGDSPNRGFYFENGGYYFAINDKVDLTLRGDIYTRGSWAVKALSNYNYRYHYNGNLSFNYIVNKYGDKGTPGYSENTNFSLLWSHGQDTKANPNSNFKASVNLVSSKFNQSIRDLNNLFTNTTSSSISYSANFGENVFFNMSADESYNTNTREIDLKLPSVNLNTNTFYPLRKKVQIGALKWYENIGVSYAMNSQNNIKTTDSTIFQKSTLENMQNGIMHSIPISSNIKLFKYFTMTNSVGYTEKWYYRTIRKGIAYDSINGHDTSYVRVDNYDGFAAAREFSLRSSLTTTYYGMLQFKNGFIRAIRHVMQPSIAFTYHPDFGNDFWGNMRTYKDENGKVVKYSIFENGIYGGPPIGRSGNVSFGISNNLEMKVRSAKDTITGMKKLVLIENLTISSAYDIAADSLKWAPLTITGRTTLFKQVFITFGNTWDPYIKNNSGFRMNTTEWNYNHRPFRLDNTNWNVSMNLALNPTLFKKKSTSTTIPKADTPPRIPNVSNVNQILEDNVDFNVNWNINIGYSAAYSNQYNSPVLSYTRSFNQYLNSTGSFNLTSKWKIGYSAIYDFNTKEFVLNSIDVYRDLHCWEMRFNWMPMGYLKSWTFTINVKASLLKDLKWDKKKDFRDNTY